MEHKCKIKLNKTNEVVEFVNSAEKCDFDIDVFYNRIIIDAKSILGVLSLDLSSVLTVRYGGKDPAFESTLKKYCVA
ncbi:MAG: HPr family phosphocarrier protein [Lachnospiraceae bacterium]